MLLLDCPWTQTNTIFWCFEKVLEGCFHYQYKWTKSFAQEEIQKESSERQEVTRINNFPPSWNQVSWFVFFPRLSSWHRAQSLWKKSWSYQRKMKFKVAFRDSRQTNPLPFFPNSIFPSGKVENFMAYVCKALVEWLFFFFFPFEKS